MRRFIDCGFYGERVETTTNLAYDLNTVNGLSVTFDKVIEKANNNVFESEERELDSYDKFVKKETEKLNTHMDKAVARHEAFMKSIYGENWEKYDM